MEKIRKETPEEISQQIDLSFEIANRLALLLEKNSLTQRKFAELIGKKESEISKWLSGTHNFTIETIGKIQAELNEALIIIPDSKVHEVFIPSYTDTPTKSKAPAPATSTMR